MSLIKSCMCDTCGKSDSPGDWARPLDWAQVSIEVRLAATGKNVIRKLDMCPDCLDKTEIWPKEDTPSPSVGAEES